MLHTFRLRYPFLLLFVLTTALALTASPTQSETLESHLKIALRNSDDSTFLQIIRAREGIDALLQLGDESPASTKGSLEVAIANKLQTIRPGSNEDREAIRQASLSVLRTTDDRQVAIGLVYQLVGSATEAGTLYTEMLRGAVHPQIISRAVAEASIFAKEAKDPSRSALLDELSNLAGGPQNWFETASLKREPVVSATPALPPAAVPDQPRAISPLASIGGALAAVIIYCAMRINWPRFRHKEPLTNR